MNKTKEILITGFALFSLFFGAGNLLLPPLLGYNAGKDWFLVTIGFIITAVIIPVLGIIAHAKLQGTMYDFGKKVSPIFSTVYCIIVYLISLAIPSPRTAAATHEIAISPFFGTSALFTSTVYFSLVLLFVLNRAKILSLIGKFLTPLIVVMLLIVIVIGLCSSSLVLNSSQISDPIVTGMFEGYQTFDAIGAVVVGAFIIVSLNYKREIIFEEKSKIILKSGIIAGLGLFLIYAGLISVGAFYGSEIIIDTTMSSNMQRATLLRSISLTALGVFGNSVLCVLISLACFTTAVGIIAGTADYFKGLFNDSKRVYVITAITGAIIGIVVGQLDFHSIIMIALPILMFIYPITIILILLNVLPNKYASGLVFKTVVLITFIFSIPDFLGFIIPAENLELINETIPFAKLNLGWVFPALVTFMLVNILQKLRSS